MIRHTENSPDHTLLTTKHIKPLGGGMDRRQFLKKTLAGCSVMVAVPFFAERIDASTEGCSNQSPNADSIQTFAFYQGLGPTERRDPSRSDGTAYKMPCISSEDLTDGTELNFDFWHGHGSKIHRFKVTEEQITQLLNGEAIEIYTDIVDGHRHAIKIDPQTRCSS
jgi:hypothetical protein